MYYSISRVGTIVLALLVLGFPGSETAAAPNTFFVAPNGSATNNGSANAPWDLATAFSATVPPGSTVLLRDGIYPNVPDGSTLAGILGAPITVRSAPGEWAILELQSSWRPSGEWVIYRDFEITAMPGNRVSETGSSGAPDLIRTPFVPSGSHQKYINLIIHNLLANGMGAVNGQFEDIEIYGNLIYHNGWIGTDRPHGHGLYLQNGTNEMQSPLQKLAVNNIVWGNAHTGIQLFGSNGYVRNFLIAGNAFFGNGSAGMTAITGRHPMRDIIFADNAAYYDTVQLGNRSGHHQTLTVENNYLAGGLFPLSVLQWNETTVTGNTVWAPVLETYFMTRGVPPPDHFWGNNTYIAGGRTTQFRHTAGKNINFDTWQAVSGFDGTSTYQVTGTEKPTGTKIFVRPNKYEEGRAQVVIYNWDGRASVPVDVSAILQPGEHYELYDAQNYFAGPILSGVFANTALQVPMSDLTAVVAPRGTGLPTPPHTAPEFAVFIVRTVFERDNPPELPTAVITANSSSGDAPLDVSFDGSGSFSGDGAPLVRYHWDFDDGTTSSEVTPTHTFVEAGTYLVTLVITDDHDMIDSAWWTIDVTTQNLEITLNKEDAGVTYTGNWVIGSGLSGKHGANYRYIAPGSGGKATFNPVINVPGNYEIQINYPVHSNRASAVTVRVHHSSGTDTLTVNMQTGGQFDLLGTYPLDDASTVEIQQNSGGYVGADAVRFTTVVQGPGPLPEITLDNEDASVTYTGNWVIGSGLRGKHGANSPLCLAAPILSSKRVCTFGRTGVHCNLRVRHDAGRSSALSGGAEPGAAVWWYAVALPLILEHAYDTQTPRETCAAFSPWTLLADLTRVHRHQQGKVPHAGGHFPWNPLMRGNVWAHETKPVLREPLWGCRRDVTPLLSQHRDLVMATRRFSERRTWKLFTEDGGLEGASSRHAANRAQTVRGWLAALRGGAPTNGGIPTAELAATAAGRDHTLVRRTGPSRSLPLDASRMAAPPMPAVPAVESPAGQAAWALVASLHARCHGHAPPTLFPTALDQATALMARDGAHRARAIVDAARHTAPTPRDNLTSFGGMVPYETCAREADDRQQQRVAAQQAATRSAERHTQSADERTAALARRTADRDPEELPRVHQRGAPRLTQEGKTARGAMGLAVRVGMDAARMPRAALPSCDAWCQQQDGTSEQVPHDAREERHA